MNTVLIGASGQLGRDIVHAWPDDNLVPLTHAAIEVTDADQVANVLAAHSPEVVINTSAFHNVDLCESEPLRAFAVNAIGALNLANACRDLGATLVHLSTDYVFSGDAGRPYHESDAPDSRNVYGVSKAAGEQIVRSRLERHCIVRTSGLYGVAGSSGKGGNFVERMLQLQRGGNDINVVDDQRLSPTSTTDLAGKIVELIGQGAIGTYHVTNSGSCSWFEFARTIFELASVDARLTPTTTAAFAAKAQRPAFSALANTRLAEVGLAPLRSWREALDEYLVAKGHVRARGEVTGGIT